MKCVKHLMKIESKVHETVFINIKIESEASERNVYLFSEYFRLFLSFVIFRTFQRIFKFKVIYVLIN